MKKSKLKSKPTRANDKTVISREEYEDYREEIYICDTCGTALEYRKVDGEESFWCNTCVIYVSPKSAKKSIQFEIPTDIHDIEPAISSIDEIEGEYGRVKIDHTPQPSGVFKSMQDKGYKISNYNETYPSGRSLKRKRDDEDE